MAIAPFAVDGTDNFAAIQPHPDNVNTMSNNPQGLPSKSITKPVILT
jgi:hypothetical protein